MKLTDLSKKANTGEKMLRETYDIPFNTEKLNISSTTKMLRKVRNLISETKQSVDYYRNQTNPAYMKLVFMEQALVQHYKELTNTVKPRIVIENEEVEKSQVVLAAQDLVDSVQKMIEETSDMLVKELPALVDSVQSEIGANESEQFNSQVSEALSQLQAQLTQAQSLLKNAVNIVTGQGQSQNFGAELDQTTDVSMQGDEVETDTTDELSVEPEMPEIEEPELGSVGRAKR